LTAPEIAASVPRLSVLDTHTLRTRLALALVLITAVPLIAGTAITGQIRECAALSDVLRERELTVGILALILLLVALLGWLVAGRLVSTLLVLGRALAAVAEGGPQVVLPRSSVREVQHVAAALRAESAGDGQGLSISLWLPVS
jgi:hypothetical protein